MRAELIKIKATGIYQGQVLPKNQLDNMDKRFQDVASKLLNKTICLGQFLTSELNQKIYQFSFSFTDRQIQLASRMEYEELKFRLLAFIVVAEMKLKSWTVKLGRQPEVEEMLDDYNVCYDSKYDSVCLRFMTQIYTQFFYQGKIIVLHFSFQDFVQKKKLYANYDKTYLDVKRRGDTYKRIDPQSKNLPRSGCSFQGN